MEAAGKPGAQEDRPEGGGPYETGQRHLSVLALAAASVLAILFSGLALHALHSAGTDALFVALQPLLPALLLYFLGVLALTLSGSLSLLATVALIFSIFWSLGLLTLSGVLLTPPVIVAVLAVNAANAILIAQLLYAVVADACRDMDIDAALGKNLQRWMVPGAIAVAAMLLPILALAPLEGDWVLSSLIAALATVLASTPVIFVALPIFLDRIPITETMVARSNRWREWRETFLLPLSMIAAPRWAYATCGIILLLSVVFFFDGGRNADISATTLMLLWRDGGFALVASSLAAAVMGALALRDWRAAIVCALAPFVFASWGAWLIVQLEIAPLASAARLLVLGGGFGAGIAILLLDAIGVYRRFDDDVQIALARAYYDIGPVILIVGLSLAAAATLFSIRFGEAAGADVMILSQIFGVALFAPCFAALLEDIFWKRKSVEELYGRR